MTHGVRRADSGGDAAQLGTSPSGEATAEAFRLEVGASGLATLSFELKDRPVNLLTRAVLEELRFVVEALGQRRDIRCLVFFSAKPGSFCHGADVELIAALDDVAEAAAGARAGQQLMTAWAELPFTTVAAIDGTCMGGGTELAVASTYRLASDRRGLRIGLPEVRIGILPAWGGCVRLPRLLDLTEALGMIAGGRSVTAQRALRLGLVDDVLPAEGFLGWVRDFALGHVGEGRPRPEADLKELLLEKNPLGRRLVFDQARRKALDRGHGHYPAPTRALEVVRVGIERGAAAGFEAEARALGELATDAACKNLIHVFRLTQAAKKDPPLPPPRPVRSSGVIGAGLMGGAIAQLVALKAEVPVRLLDRRPQALEQALLEAELQHQNRIKRRRLTPAEARHVMGRLQPALDGSGLGRADLVVEAVDEELAVKLQVFAQLAKVVPDETVLASNTSSLSIADLAREVPAPERVLGLHFFNPVHQVPLVEVVAGPMTSPQALATARAFVRRLGKTPLAVRDRPGFLVNRLLGHYMLEALWLLADGLSPERIDRTLTEWGWPVGPFALIDRIGLDVALASARRLEAAFGDRLVLPRWNWQKAFLEDGRLGEKAGGGFYRYEEGRRRGLDVDALSRLGVPAAARGPVGAVEIADRILLPMVDEAARCLEEEVVEGPEQVDLGLILGAGFPPFRGGLCRWADRQGLAGIVEVLERLAGQTAQRLAPSPALRGAARRGRFYR